MTSFSTGRQAEAAAVRYLENKGYIIKDQNWRTRFCEIDIIAEKNKCLYLIEVKYRHKNDWGDGLAYITSAKLKQMAFAAEMWVQSHEWSGEYTLGAIEVSGEAFEVTTFLSSLEGIS